MKQLALFVAILCGVAFGQTSIQTDRVDALGAMADWDRDIEIVHSGGYVFIYANGGVSRVHVNITTEAQLIEAAFGGGTVEASDGPRTVQLLPAYPNPFNPVTTIDFSLAQTEAVRLTVHNLLGEEVAVILDRLMEPGSHTASFDGAGLASGVYTYTLQVGGFSQTKTFTLVK